MTNRIHRHDAAWQDLDDLAAFIQKDSPQAAIRFLEKKGFPKHLIFYRPIDHGIEVVRVLHGARDIEAVFEDDA